MELTGKVILDDSSMEKLKNELREEIINDIELHGLEYKEVIKLTLSKINYPGEFSNVLIDILPIFLDKIKCDTYLTGRNDYKKLKMCNDILHL